MTCLDSQDHGCNIKDHLLHYLGCIEISKRETFFSADSEIWQDEVKHQKNHFGHSDEEAENLTRRKRESWKADCESELRRIEFLRKTLSRDKNDKHLIQKLKGSRANWLKKCGRNAEITNGEREDTGEYILEKDISAPIIQFENGHCLDINANHAISRYFGEERPNYQKAHRELMRQKKTKTYMILQDSYWRSQLHGCQQHNPPHARHMKPLCERVSSGNVARKLHYFPNNMVVFMPYLHWDISRRSEQFAMEIGDIMEEAKLKALQLEKEAKEKRRKERNEIETIRASNDSRNAGQPVKNRRTRGRILTMTSLLKEMKLIRTRLPVDENGRVEVVNHLGQYLIDAARLFEGIYLCADPPLHPRRTLDQAYHWTLSSTWHRDRDQVVYRHTTTKPEDFHRYDHKERKWTEHEEFGIKDPCNECNMGIKKLSRVIMVDQLWMWILDAKTIITCFPKRYGANKQDTSAIHKSIRVHLQDNSPDQIRTVFDLALVIIDECSNTFFDRTKTGDRLPQVLDAFSIAIGNIRQKHTAAFDRLWRWTDDAGEIYRTNTNGDTSGLHVQLLDINPEGKLEREIKDIIEELDIMIQVMREHKRTLTAFFANAENILDPFGEFGDDLQKRQKRKMISGYLWDKSSKRPEDLTALRNAIDNPGSDDTMLKKKQDDYDWFKLNADERLESVMERIGELEELRKSATDTAHDVKDLLELKQQQASVVQAWQAVKQSEATIQQGRSIMMFTLVTIIFLPLSFMSSIFGMNNSTITNNTPIKLEFMYMFPISAAVIFVSLFFAFGSWIRAGVFYMCKWLVTSFLVRTGLYGLWLEINWPSKRLHREANDYSDRLKKNAKIANLKRRCERREREQENKVKKKNKKRDDEDRALLGDAGILPLENGHGNDHSTSNRGNRKAQSAFPLRYVRRRSGGALGNNDIERGQGQTV
ncbi:hypothetical protein F5Y13DRAFT_206631 [Hypoxylon sp. FL1857]|nr:hypothetical protein F5Y13DRAFT_206631 [Hypoxylon sp. FL1857]